MSTIEHIVAPEEVMAYLDGGLPPDRAATVGAHLSDCATCTALAAELREVSDDLRRWQVEPPPATVSASRIPHRRGRSERWFYARWSPSVRHAAAAAVVVLALGSAMWVATVRREPAPDPAQAFLGTTDRADGLSASAGRGPGGGSIAVDGSLRGSGTGRRGPAAIAAQPARTALGGGSTSASPAQAPNVEPRGPQIVRTVNLTIVTKHFAAVRPAVDRILRDVGGFVGDIQVGSDVNGESLRGTVRVPTSRLDDAVRALRELGHVLDETQSGEDVTEHVRDLEARLVNGRNTEKRLAEILRNRTGDLSDILQVEREIARVREEIERMDAERANLERRVTYATITLVVTQERQATLDLGPQSLSTKFRNAIVDGLRDAFEGVTALALSMLRIGPTVLLWIALLWWPVRVLARRARGWATP